MALRILQITDCHLFSDPDAELRGIPTWPRFVATLAALREQFPDCDGLVISGDVAHDEAPSTYDAVRGALGDWTERTHLLPGNHDCRAGLRHVFPQCRDGGLPDRVTFSLRLGTWQILGLDSQIPGAVSGELGAEQIAWLRAHLEAHAGLATVLFLHHPPVEVGSAWLDRLRLRDRARLLGVLRDFSQVELVCCGHVHQDFTARVAGTTVFATPAVGPQFVPRIDELAIDDLPPAARLLELDDDGTWTSQVLRFRTR